MRKQSIQNRILGLNYIIDAEQKSIKRSKTTLAKYKEEVLCELKRLIITDEEGMNYMPDATTPTEYKNLDLTLAKVRFQEAEIKDLERLIWSLKSELRKFEKELHKLENQESTREIRVRMF